MACRALVSILLLAGSVSAAITDATIFHRDTNKIGVSLTSDAIIDANKKITIELLGTDGEYWKWSTDSNLLKKAMVYSRSGAGAAVQIETLEVKVAGSTGSDQYKGEVTMTKSIGDKYYKTDDAQILLFLPIVYQKTGGEIKFTVGSLTARTTGAYDETKECACGSGTTGHALIVGMKCKSKLAKTDDDAIVTMIDTSDVIFKKTELETLKTASKMDIKINGTDASASSLDQDGVLSEINWRSSTDIAANSTFNVEFMKKASTKLDEIKPNFDIKCDAHMFCKTTKDSISYGSVTFCSSASMITSPFVAISLLLVSISQLM